MKDDFYKDDSLSIGLRAEGFTQDASKVSFKGVGEGRRFSKEHIKLREEIKKMPPWASEAILSYKEGNFRFTDSQTGAESAKGAGGLYLTHSQDIDAANSAGLLRHELGHKIDNMIMRLEGEKETGKSFSDTNKPWKDAVAKVRKAKIFPKDSVGKHFKKNELTDMFSVHKMDYPEEAMRREFLAEITNEYITQYVKYGEEGKDKIDAVMQRKNPTLYPVFKEEFLPVFEQLPEKIKTANRETEMLEKLEQNNGYTKQVIVDAGQEIQQIQQNSKEHNYNPEEMVSRVVTNLEQTCDAETLKLYFKHEQQQFEKNEKKFQKASSHEGYDESFLKSTEEAVAGFKKAEDFLKKHVPNYQGKNTVNDISKALDFDVELKENQKWYDVAGYFKKKPSEKEYYAACRVVRSAKGVLEANPEYQDFNSLMADYQQEPDKANSKIVQNFIRKHKGFLNEEERQEMSSKQEKNAVIEKAFNQEQLAFCKKSEIRIPKKVLQEMQGISAKGQGVDASEVIQHPNTPASVPRGDQIIH